MLETLSNEYARIQRLDSLYDKERMNPSVTLVYTLGIQFLQDAARFYGFKSYRRFWHILAKPPSVDLQERVLSIQNAISGLERERETQNNERLFAIDMKANG